MIYTRIAAVVVILVALSASHWKAYTSGRNDVQAEWDADIAQRTAEALAASEQARAKEQELQTKADNMRKAKDAQIHALDLRLDESLKRLRNRPERPAAVAEVPDSAGVVGSPRGCTGAELYRSDGEFLVGLAADADKLRIALRACQATYRAAHEAVTSRPEAEGR